MTSAKEIKEYIEAKSGLSLGDAVNVAMFILTALSFVAAAIGIGIAMLAYESADTGANKQLEAMNAQQRILNESAETLRKDFEHRQEIERRRPILNGMISCSAVDRLPRASQVPFLASPELQKISPILKVRRSSGDLLGYQTYTCVVQVTNTGDAPVEDGFMHFTWNGERSAGIKADAVKARVADYNDLSGGDEGWYDAGLVLFDNAKIYTVAIYGRPNEYRFQIRVAGNLDRFRLNWYLVGSNFPRVEGSLLFVQEP